MRCAADGFLPGEAQVVVIARECGRSSNRNRRWLLDAPLSRGMTVNGLGRLIDQLAHAGRRRGLLGRGRVISVAVVGLLLRRRLRRCSGFWHDDLDANTADAHEWCFLLTRTVAGRRHFCAARTRAIRDNAE